MKRFLFFLRSVLLSLLLVSTAFAQGYPDRPIKIIIPFPPGDTLDMMTRVIAPKISERLGQPIIVENRPGASGVIGMDLVAKSKPDGYTLVAAQGGNMVVLPHTTKIVNYNPLKDFSLIAVSTFNYMAIAASPNAPFKTFPQMIAWAKANPGKLTVGTNGEGGFPHMTFEHLAISANIKFTHVPYKGAAQIVTDLAGGQVMVGIAGISSFAPHARSGTVNLVAITNKERVALWPDTPTVAETIPGWTAGGWFGYAGPAGMPQDIVTKWNAEINRAFKSPDVIEQMSAAGLIITTEPPEFFTKVLNSDYARYGKLVKDIQFVPQ
jgi:tripartite-type tricarboxylate transporter receptor subunit TctC